MNSTYSLLDLSDDDEFALQGALLLPHRDQQYAYLKLVCNGDAARLSRLEELLDSQTLAETLFSPVEVSLDATETENTRAQRVGKFKLIRPIGSGGMGTVFLAEDGELKRLVALKIPRVDFIANDRHRQRFLLEAKLAAKLQHPGLVSVLEVGSVGAVTYIASELCEQGDLARWLETSDVGQPAASAAEFVADLCDAVEHIHSHGVLHLDIKPSNILLRLRSSPPEPDGNSTDQLSTARIQLEGLAPKVSDFGVSRAIDADATGTHTSLVLGTLLYMAPEQIVPSIGQVSHRSDIYSVGVVLAQLLKIPLRREGTSFRMIVSTLDEDGPIIPEIDLSDLAGDLETILLKCTALQPEARYDSAKSLARDLRSFADGEPIQARRPGMLNALWPWLARRGRIKDAWWVCLGCNLVGLIWMLAGMFLIFGSNFPGDSRTLAVVACVTLVCFNTFPMIAFSSFGLKGHRWPLTPAFLLVLIGTVCVPISVLGDFVDAVPGLYDNSPFFEELNHYLVLGFGIVQLVALTVAKFAARQLHPSQSGR